GGRGAATAADLREHRSEAGDHALVAVGELVELPDAGHLERTARGERRLLEDHEVDLDDVVERPGQLLGRDGGREPHAVLEAAEAEASEVAADLATLVDLFGLEGVGDEGPAAVPLRHRLGAHG